MLNITITIESDDTEVLDAAIKAASLRGFYGVRKYHMVEVTVTETHQLEDFAVTLHQIVLEG